MLACSHFAVVAHESRSSRRFLLSQHNGSLACGAGARALPSSTGDDVLQEALSPALTQAPEAWLCLWSFPLGWTPLASLLFALRFSCSSAQVGGRTWLGPGKTDTTFWKSQGMPEVGQGGPGDGHTVRSPNQTFWVFTYCSFLSSLLKLRNCPY